jgi:hypothetical protein
MKLPEQRGPSREDCRREAGAWWEKYRCAPNDTSGQIALAHCEAWLGLLWDLMSPQERAQVELRPIDEPIAYG